MSKVICGEGKVLGVRRAAVACCRSPAGEGALDFCCSERVSDAGPGDSQQHQEAEGKVRGGVFTMSKLSA